MGSFKKIIRNIITEAGIKNERQEMGIITAINIIANKNNPITVITDTNIIKNVIYASKKEGLNDLGQEPYTDIVFTLSNGKNINISAKGVSAASLAGAGVTGLNSLVPNLLKKVLEKALNTLIKKGYKKGDDIPDIYCKIPDEQKIIILTGNEKMGGPIDYMYQGPMDVKAQIDTKQNTVKLNGSLIKVNQYSKQHNLYIRIRRRRNDQTFDPNLKDKYGYPAIFGKSPSKGDSNRRIVITDHVPNSAILIDI